jgi:hypothetical protein
MCSRNPKRSGIARGRFASHLYPHGGHVVGNLSVFCELPFVSRLPLLEEVEAFISVDEGTPDERLRIWCGVRPTPTGFK